ncbi:hypothetical protein [uncultured Acinetobacter sp.]|uniref:hypothetical protein n=1 Tax=uncultured Acinetobacter sp. TaxID=165433 RepID=UPI0025828876|nr:hypothetical protein [uncultured Acinetobacter sp.]
MADQLITRQELIDAKPDVKNLGEAANGNETGIVVPRYGAPYSTAPAAIQKIESDGAAAIAKLENTGGFISAPTLTALQAITPEYDYQLARVDATGDEYRWNPALTTTVKWEATGRNFLSESKADATNKANAAKSQAITVSTKYSDLTKADKALASDPNVAMALSFKDGERTWVEVGYDGKPTSHAKEILNNSLDKADKAIASDSDVAIALTFKDGERTWLEAGYDGEPTERSVNILKKHFSQSSSDFKLSDRFVSLSTQKTGATSISREYPVFQRASGPLITYAQQSSESIYWTWVINKEAWGGTGLALFYSTDHAAHAPSGIFLFEADSIEGPWVNRGKVYRDDFSGDQTETPSVIYDPVSNKVLMFYQQANVAGSVGAQQTVLATANPSDLTSWTRAGVVLDKGLAAQDGDGHCGYFRPFFYSGELLGYSLYGGTNYSNAALWRSKDGGYTWKRDGSMIGWMQDKCKHLASVLNTTQNLCVLTMYEGDVINWRGQPWWIGVVGVAQSGSVGTRNSRLVAAPLSDDFTSLKTKVVDITPPKAAYEAVNGIDYPGNLFVWDGEVYSAYRTNGQRGSIALMKMING